MNKDVNKILKIIDEAPQNFADKIPDIEKKIFKEISVLLKDLKTTKDGRIESSVENLKLINSIKGRIGKIILGKEYVNAVRDFVSQFSVVAQMPSMLADLNAETQQKISLVTKMTIDNTLESLVGSGLRQEVIDKLYKTLITNVTTGGSYADMQEWLKSEVVSDKESEGMIQKYSKTYITDTMGVFAGQNNKLVADMLDSEWFSYEGTNIETTREFCEHLTEKRWVHKSEIPTLLEGLIDGHQCELYRGMPKGMKEETTPDNFIVLRGGWNCGHQLIPVNEVAVPKEVREAIEGGEKNEEVSKQQIEKEENDVKNMFANSKRKPTAEMLEFGKKYNLSEAEVTAIFEYTKTQYTDINPALRNGNLTPEQQSYVNVMNRGLDKLKGYEGVAYRGIEALPDNVIQEYKTAYQNKTIHIEKAFTSSSIVKKASDEFGTGISLTINSKNGKNVNNLSVWKDMEDEILFKSGTKFNVSSFEELTDKYGHKTYNITLIEI